MRAIAGEFLTLEQNLYVEVGESRYSAAKGMKERTSAKYCASKADGVESRGAPGMVYIIADMR